MTEIFYKGPHYSNPTWNDWDMAKICSAGGFAFFMNKSWTSCKQVVNKSWTGHKQVINRSRTSWANPRVKLHSQVHFEYNKFLGLQKCWVKKSLSPINLGSKFFLTWPVWFNQSELNLTCHNTVLKLELKQFSLVPS